MARVRVTSMPAGGGGLTDAELRATPVPVSVTGGATSEKQDTGNTSIASIDGKLPALSGGRVPVELPAGGSGLTDSELRAAAVAVSQASQPLPTGAATSAKQDSEIAALGAPADAEATGDGSIIAILKRLRTLLGGTLSVAGTITASISNAVLKAREDTAAMSWVSAKTAAPAASAVQCDTGALAAGEYDFDIQLACADTVAVGKGLVVEHRNAANSATLQNLAACTPNGGALQVQIRRFTIALNERIRVIAGTAAGAASSMYVSSIGRRLA